MTARHSAATRAERKAGRTTATLRIGRSLRIVVERPDGVVVTAWHAVGARRRADDTRDADLSV